MHDAAAAHEERVTRKDSFRTASGQFEDPTGGEDEDVAAERRALIRGDVGADAPIRIMSLRKVYPGGKVAVDSVTLHMEANECFGMLGPNGAGKTTTISILTGLFKQTKGTAFVNGYNISTEMHKVYERMGICPQ